MINAVRDVMMTIDNHNVMTIPNEKRDLMSASRLGKLNLLFDSTPILGLKGVKLNI